MKGIILAGGSGTRLYPVTKAVNKHLLPVYNKPMIYYPLSVLMLSGIRQILIISSPRDISGFQSLFGDGNALGLSIDYAEQSVPGGIPQAFTIGREFIGSSPVCLILGDNIFFGQGLTGIVRRSAGLLRGAKAFAYWVDDPQRYCVVDFDTNWKPARLVEKPLKPESNYAVPGLYYYDGRVVDIAADIRPSARGELEITDVNLAYLRLGDLEVERLGRGIAWLDTGTHQAWLQASNFIETLEQRQGLQLGCLEEIAYRLGYINSDDLAKSAAVHAGNSYGRYLKRIINEAGIPAEIGLSSVIGAS